VIVKLFITNSRLLRKMLRPKAVGRVGLGETGGSGILHDLELQNVILVDILKVVKSSRIVCVEYITCTGEKRNSWKVFVGKF
jgi:hypothetical protein